MRIAVTGAAGHLGSRLCPMLAERGHELIRTDVAEAPDGPGEFRQADLIDAAQAREAIGGAEMVVHCASIHPWKPYAADQYLDCDLKAAWHVFAAAAELGITRVVHTSSIAVYGDDCFPPDLWPVGEDHPPTDPADIYRVAKMAQELMARCFASTGALRVATLRPPAFMPRSDLETGLSLLGHFALVDDVAAAHVAAVEHFDALPGAFEPFNATNALPYTRPPSRHRASLARRLGLLSRPRHHPGAASHRLRPLPRRAPARLAAHPQLRLVVATAPDLRRGGEEAKKANSSRCSSVGTDKPTLQRGGTE